MLSKIKEFFRPNITHVTNVTIIGEEVVRAAEARSRELLIDNNHKLETIRSQRAMIRQLTGLVEANSDLLIKHSLTTGYCGCDLELETCTAVAKAKELFHV